MAVTVIHVFNVRTIVIIWKAKSSKEKGATQLNVSTLPATLRANEKKTEIFLNVISVVEKTPQIFFQLSYF